MRQQEQANRLVKSQRFDAKREVTKKFKWSMKICIKIQLETCHSIFNKDVFVVANCHRSTEEDSGSKLRGVCHLGWGE